jgi:hypothetical protein
MQHLRTEEMLNLIAYRQYRKGRRRFFLVYGILLYGMSMFCVMNAVQWYSDPFHFKGIWLISWLIFSLGFWALADMRSGGCNGVPSSAGLCVHRFD